MQTLKGLLKKADEEGRDPYIASCCRVTVKISQLPDKTAKTIITHRKRICSRHGIPEEIVSDNMPFGSREFKDFAHE